ncbi:MAG TPA: phosphoglucomutase/phosphomannomutase family protein [Anaerolineaceae bacterium]|nr:phosphoglucomutase/phosphomannomutase family protein [Longilinea sp.]HNR47219.1 phosphoglucomutase/phosphomannomutase family protein [Anaerolineaceae bacterium]HNS37652.1 phosphoglucomutase/phosphomannomutase family protein [Anaerolineaceae bacterium]HNZ12034.1 phosphoglucomutase/phosphomannomutase family protein [Anaerolineaceae bacterium]HOD03539.1 phosphoglucomutase/phosphomannomutase family protein [Anaerolineaceae bacterium]
MSTPIRFGTDGWRGVIAEDYTFDNVRRCTQGFADYMLRHGKKDQWFIVGHDKRFHSENFALAVAEVLAGNGLRVYLTNGATPTPVIAFSVVNRKAAGAINITASHNPPTDNGFKVRDENGGAISPEGLNEIESLIPDSVAGVRRMKAAEAEAAGRLVRFDPAPAYIEHLADLIDLQPIRDAGLNIVVDAMWGNGAGWFSHLLAGGTTKVTEIHNTRNPIFPEMKRPEPIQPNINVGLQTTVDLGADVLLITDGDADRVGVGDEQGRFINQLQVYALLALYMLEVRGERGPIVKTLSTTSMLEKLGKIYDIPIYETGVGFKYVAPMMIETQAMMGGEESGGFAFRDNVPERDGILAGLFILDMMVKLKLKPSELIDLLYSKVGAHYYDRIDTSFSGDRKAREDMILSAKPETIGGLKVTGLNTMDGYKFSLEDGGWVLIRFSGTEPIMRVYCETTHKEAVQAILKDGMKIAGLA